MAVVVEELQPTVIGAKLGNNVYNSNGNLLLRRGVEINPHYYAHFEKKGYRSIYILDGPPDVEYDENLVPDRIVATSPHALRKIFGKLLHPENRYSLNTKGELIDLASLLLQSVNRNVHKTSPIQVLKTPEDYLFQHSINVAIYSILIGRQLQYDEKKLFSLTMAALLHDFGMMFVDEQIVNKTESLSPAEFELIKRHTTVGFQHLVRNCSFDGLSSVASMQHHERYDGKGYPKSLTVDNIHEYSRIITLTDLFDALTSDRPHRRMNSIPNAVDFIRRNEARIFDPKVVKTFLECIL